MSDAPNDPHLNLSWPFSEEGIRHHQKMVSDLAYVTFFAFDNTIAVGHIVGGQKKVSYRDVKIAEIVEMGISPSHRSQGIGSQLIVTLRRWCKERGYQKLMVNAYCNNSKAIEFYQRQGLTPIDIDLEMDL